MHAQCFMIMEGIKYDSHDLASFNVHFFCPKLNKYGYVHHLFFRHFSAHAQTTLTASCRSYGRILVLNVSSLPVTLSLMYSTMSRALSVDNKSSPLGIMNAMMISYGCGWYYYNIKEEEESPSDVN